MDQSPHAIAHPSGKKSPLLNRLIEQLTLCHYSERTIDTYQNWVLRYIRFHGKQHPRELDRDHVEEFLTSLAIQSNVSASTQNQALAAISFLYRDVLNVPLEDREQLARARRPYVCRWFSPGTK
jgi:site-specific recombinase XerD